MSDHIEAVKLSAQLIREMVTELVRGLEQEIVCMVLHRFASLEVQSAQKQPTEAELFHTELSVVPDKTHQH